MFSLTVLNLSYIVKDLNSVDRHLQYEVGMETVVSTNFTIDQVHSDIFLYYTTHTFLDMTVPFYYV